VQGGQLTPGSAIWTWDGTDQSGRMVPPGAYTAVLTATTGALSSTVRTPLTVAAFGIATTPTTLVRGQNITVTAVSAEPLTASPQLTISQPGVATRVLTMILVSANTYRVTTRLSGATAARAGTLILKVSGTDAGHGVNIATSSLTLR